VVEGWVETELEDSEGEEEVVEGGWMKAHLLR
jgi:hypothetical protein